jgi:hypothetical protein
MVELTFVKISIPVNLDTIFGIKNSLFNKYISNQYFIR